MLLLTGLEEKQRQDKREREQRPLPSRQLGQGLLPHGAKRHLNLESPTWKVKERDAWSSKWIGWFALELKIVMYDMLIFAIVMIKLWESSRGCMCGKTRYETHMLQRPHVFASRSKLLSP